MSKVLGPEDVAKLRDNYLVSALNAAIVKGVMRRPLRVFYLDIEDSWALMCKKELGEENVALPVGYENLVQVLVESATWTITDRDDDGFNIK